MRLHFALLLLGALAAPGPAQTPAPALPCAFTGHLLRTHQGQIAIFQPNEMKNRATHKVELVPGILKMADFRGTVFVDLLVDSTGKVACLRTVSGLQLIRKPVEAALLQWTFQPAKQNGKPVAYRGFLEFTLCTLSCGDEGMNWTLLK